MQLHVLCSPRSTFLVLAVVLALSAGSPARGSETSALINKELDRQVNLELDDFLPSVLMVIELRTSVPLRADPVVWELLPWGQQTKITAKIQNQTLRQALSAIMQKLGLQIILADEAVMIEPMPGLRRLGRRSTVDEIQGLDILASTPMPRVADVGSVRSVLTAIDLKLDSMQAPLAIEDRLDAQTRARILNLPRNATMMDALEMITKQTRGTWYPWARTIVVVPKETQIRNQLGRTVSERYDNVHIAQVLENLRRRAGVPFDIEPGALQKISPDARAIRIFWDNISVEQALTELAGFTGIDWAVTDEGVRIRHAGQPGAAVNLADPVMAMVTLENGITLLVRESQIPPELREYLRQRLDKTIGELRTIAEKENFPLTQPAPLPPTAPQPATQPTP